MEREYTFKELNFLLGSNEQAYFYYLENEEFLSNAKRWKRASIVTGCIFASYPFVNNFGLSNLRPNATLDKVRDASFLTLFIFSPLAFTRYLILRRKSKKTKEMAVMTFNNGLSYIKMNSKIDWTIELQNNSSGLSLVLTF